MSFSVRGSTVLITGGAGFIGSHLARALVKHGAKEVRLLDSLRYGDPANVAGIGENVRLARFTLGADPRDKLTELLTGVDLVFHLAAEKHNQSKDSPALVFRANIDGTLELFETAAQAGVKKVVFSSSLYAYGQMSEPPMSESMLPQPNTIYGISKLVGERLADYCRRTYALDYTVLRYFFVYGPRQFAGMGYKSVIIKNFERILNGEPPTIYGDGEQALDYVFVEDVTYATISAMEADLSGEVLNIGSGVPTTVNELIAAMLRVTGSKLRPLHQEPDWTAGSWRVGDNTRAWKLLGWRPAVSLEQGLAATYAWMRER